MDNLSDYDEESPSEGNAKEIGQDIGFFLDEFRTEFSMISFKLHFSVDSSIFILSNIKNKKAKELLGRQHAMLQYKVSLNNGDHRFSEYLISSR